MNQQKTHQIRSKLYKKACKIADNLKDRDPTDITTMDVRYEVTQQGDVKEIKLLISQGPRTELHLHSKELRLSRSGVVYTHDLGEHDELLNALGMVHSREVTLSP